jgi:Lipopolysaccharide-assembly
MKTPARFAAIFFSVACLIGSTGCGYSSGNLYRSDINTVCVEVFESKEFRRGLEFQLTEAVKKRIATDTPYRVASAEKADTILRGEVLEQRQGSFAPDFATRQPRDRQLNLVVRLTWKDLRSGQLLLDQPVELSSVDYLPPAGETEEFAQTKGIERLARKIVSRMYAEW